MTRVAINGFGRIGRQFYRIASKRPELEIVAVNDLADPRTLACLLEYDSVYGRFEGGLTGAEMLAEKDPAELPWKKLKVDVVVEATGRFTRREGARRHLEAGAKKVVVSANSEDADLSVVLGVNQSRYDPQRHHIVSNCSCTTNCAAPVVKLLNENFGLAKAQMTTVHAVTASQSLVDGPKRRIRRGRAALDNIIPTTTGAAEAVVRVLPELGGRVGGSAFRVPVLCGSVLEVVAQVGRKAAPAEINDVFRRAAAGELEGILAVSEGGLVSRDIVGRPFSAVVDLPLTEVLASPQVEEGATLVKVAAWYDNEWGYSTRLVELVEMVGRSL